MKGDVDICAAMCGQGKSAQNQREKMEEEGRERRWKIGNDRAKWRGDRRETQNKMAEWVALIEKVVTCD